jgi:hypothetical protein
MKKLFTVFAVCTIIAILVFATYVGVLEMNISHYKIEAKMFEPAAQEQKSDMMFNGKYFVPFSYTVYHGDRYTLQLVNTSLGFCVSRKIEVSEKYYNNVVLGDSIDVKKQQFKQ